MVRQLLIIILLGVTVLLRSQTVDSIEVEQAGDFIRIGYKILNSTPSQVYRVRVLCSINGGLNTELRSVSGDTGDNVQGGKQEYFVVWDVLKDVEELNSADFIVRAELVSDKSPERTKKSNRNFIVMLPTQLPGFGYGIRTGYSGAFGISAQFISGKTVYLPDHTDRDIFRLNRFSLDLSSRLVNNEAFQLHLLTGISVGQNVIEDENGGNISYPVHMSPGVEGGLLFCHKRIVYSLSLARQFPDMVEEGTAITKHTYLGIGFGLRL